jgi:hypothetical protein
MKRANARPVSRHQVHCTGLMESAIALKSAANFAFALGAPLSIDTQQK